MAKKVKKSGTAGVINNYKGKPGAGKPTSSPAPSMKKGGTMKSKKGC